MTHVEGLAMNRRARRAWALRGMAAVIVALAAPPARAEVALAGTEFWACDLENSWPDQPLGLVVGNPQPIDVVVGVEDASGPLASAVVPAGGLHAFTLDRSRMMAGTSLAPNAYRVTATAPVRLQQVNPLTQVQVHTYDVSTLLPVEALGTIYRPLSRESYQDTVLFCDDLPGSIAVVAIAVEPTTVAIIPNAPVRGGALPATPAGTPIVVTMNRFDALHLVTEVGHGPDLTGSLVLSDRPIAVFGGSPITFVPATSVAAEHLEEQCFPVESWGREYLLVKAKRRTTESDLWRVVAAEDGTSVTLTPPVVAPFVLDAGEHLELATPEDVHLVASAPVQVGQYFVGAGPVPGVSPGDPSLLVAIPVEQYGDEHFVMVPDTHSEDYLTVIREPATAVDLDGAPVPAAAFVAIGTTGWERAWIAVSDGPHRVIADGPVGVSFYGYDEYAAYGSHGGSRFARTGGVSCDAVAGAASCVDGTLSLDGSASAGPGPGPLEFTWSSLTPGLVIASPEDAVSAAAVSGPGPWRVALTVTSGAAASSCFLTIEAPADVVPPELTCPALVTSPTTSPGFAEVRVLASVLDECDPAPVVVNDRTAGGSDAGGAYPCGETLVTFTATDASGLADSCTTRVVVTDAAPPPGLSEIDGRRLRVRRDPASADLLEITFEAPSSPAQTVSLYAGTVAPTGIVAYDHLPLACHAMPSLSAPGVASLPAPLEPGAGRYYLVSASNCLAESTRGFRSDGIERPVLATDCGPLR